MESILDNQYKQMVDKRRKRNTAIWQLKQERLNILESIKEHSEGLKNALYEEMKYPQFSQSVSEQLTQMIKRLRERNREVDDQLKALESCMPFEEKVGWYLHDVYRKKYPFLSDTEFVESQGKAWQIQAILPQDETLDWSAPDTEIPLSVSYETTIVKFEEWGWRNDDTEQYIRLGYSPELNRIYWWGFQAREPMSEYRVISSRM